MKKRIVVAGIVLFLSALFVQAQSKPADTVVIKVGEASRITFTIQNKNDLETLKKYDIQTLVNDLIKKLEEKDTSKSNSAQNYVKEEIKKETEVSTETQEEDWGNSISQEDRKKWDRHHRTHNSINFDIGTNNYLTSNGFPDQDNSLFTVRPWGSWYVGINSVQRTQLTNRFFLEWGLGVSWYNFKFENEQTVVSKDAGTVQFNLDARTASFQKSKLTASYINASIVPMLDFGSNHRKPSFFDGDNSKSFRIGAGPYVGYRIDSYSKQVLEIEGDEKKPKNRDNFYLNNLRYGMRVQVGFDDVDLFFNYDMNELFSENKGPQLNAFSFGVTF